jgi:hypothetical protein
MVSVHKNSRLFFISIFLFFVSFESLGEEKMAWNNLLGKWDGAIILPNRELVMRLNVSSEQDITLDSVSQNVSGLEVSNFVFDDDSISFSVNDVQGKFSGKLSSDKTSLDGKWSQRNNSFPMKLSKEEVNGATVKK